MKSATVNASSWQKMLISLIKDLTLSVQDLVKVKNIKKSFDNEVSDL